MTVREKTIPAAPGPSPVGDGGRPTRAASSPARRPLDAAGARGGAAGTRALAARRARQPRRQAVLEGRLHHGLRHGGAARWSPPSEVAGSTRSRDIGVPGEFPVHPRHPPHRLPRQAVDDAAVRRLRHAPRDTNQRFKLPARARPDRPLGGLRPADALRLRLRPRDVARARSGSAASRSTRWPTWSGCSTASRWARSRPR